MKNSLVKHLVITNILIVFLAVASAKPKPPNKHQNGLHHSEKEVHIMVDVDGHKFMRMDRSVAQPNETNVEHMLSTVLHTDVTNQSLTRFVKSLLKKIQEAESIKQSSNIVQRVKREEAFQNDSKPKKHMLMKPKKNKRRETKKEDASVDKTNGKNGGRKVLEEEGKSDKIVAENINEDTKKLEAEIGSIAARVQLTKQEIQIPVQVISESEITAKIQPETKKTEEKEDIAPKIQSESKIEQETAKETEIAQKIQAENIKEEVKDTKEEIIAPKIQTEETQEPAAKEEGVSTRFLTEEESKESKKEEISPKIQAENAETTVAKEESVASKILDEKPAVKVEVIAKIQTEEKKDEKIAPRILEETKMEAKKEESVASKILPEKVVNETQEIAAKIQTEETKTENEESSKKEEIEPGVLEEESTKSKTEATEVHADIAPKIQSEEEKKVEVAPKIQTEDKNTEVKEEITKESEESVAPKIQAEEKKDEKIVPRILEETKIEAKKEESIAPKILEETKKEESVATRILEEPKKEAKKEESVVAKIQTEEVNETESAKKEEVIAAKIQAEVQAEHAKDEEKIAAKVLTDKEASTEVKKEQRRNIQSEGNLGEEAKIEEEATGRFQSDETVQKETEKKIRKLSGPKKIVPIQVFPQDQISARIQAAANQEVAKIVSKMQSMSGNDENMSTRIQAAIDKEVANLLARIKADQEKIASKASQIDKIASRMAGGSEEDGGIALRIQEETISSESDKIAPRIQSEEEKEKSKEESQGLNAGEVVAPKIQTETGDIVAEDVSSKLGTSKDESIASKIQSEDSDVSQSEASGAASNTDESVASKIQSEQSEDASKSDASESVGPRIQSESEESMHASGISSKISSEESKSLVGSESASIEGMVSSRMEEEIKSALGDVATKSEEKSGEHIEEIAARIGEEIVLQATTEAPPAPKKQRMRMKIIRVPVRLAFSRYYDFQDEDFDEQSLVGRFEKSIINNPFLNDFEDRIEKHDKCTTPNCVVNIDNTKSFHSLDAEQMNKAKSLVENYNDTHLIEISLKVNQFPFHFINKRDSNDTKMHHDCNMENCKHKRNDEVDKTRNKRDFERDSGDLVYENKKPCNNKGSKNHVKFVDRRKREAANDSSNIHNQKRKKIRNFVKIFSKKKLVKRSHDKPEVKRDYRFVMCHKNH